MIASWTSLGPVSGSAMPSVSSNDDQDKRDVFGVEGRRGEGETSGESEAQRPRRERAEIEADFESILDTEATVDLVKLEELLNRIRSFGLDRSSSPWPLLFRELAESEFE